MIHRIEAAHNWGEHASLYIRKYRQLRPLQHKRPEFGVANSGNLFAVLGLTST